MNSVCATVVTENTSKGEKSADTVRPHVNVVLHLVINAICASLRVCAGHRHYHVNVFLHLVIIASLTHFHVHTYCHCNSHTYNIFTFMIPTEELISKSLTRKMPRTVFMSSTENCFKPIVSLAKGWKWSH